MEPTRLGSIGTFKSTAHYRPKDFRQRKLLLRILCIFLSCSIGILLLFNSFIHPKLRILAEAEARNHLQKLLYEAMAKTVASSNLDYDDLIRIRYTSSGTVASLSVDSAHVNLLRSELVTVLMKKLNDRREMRVSIPLGTLSGLNLISGRGPDLSIRLLFTQSFRAYLESDFDEKGINQTLHRILFVVELNCILLIPSRTTELDLPLTFCIAETVIVGEVPDAYTEITRLTDDITEEDIDDIYDFGATVSP